MEVLNNSNEVKYFDTLSHHFRDGDDIIRQFLKSNFTVSKDSLNNHSHNSSFYICTPDKYRCIIENIVPIPPKTKWTLTNNGFALKEPKNIFQKRPFNIDDFLKSVYGQLKLLRDKKIGVQLSGGLDSSLIIGILRHFGIEPVLVGMYNKRYEFRTERIVQKILVEKSSEYTLINDDKFLPFTDLLNVPKHILPSATSLFYSGEEKMSQLFKKSKVDVVFNGMGLDSILCLSPNDNENRNQWYPFMFDDCWFSDYVYNPKKIYFTPSIKSHFLVNVIWNMRYSQIEDNTKQWARNIFYNFLPEELVKFNYKSDHIGLLIDGIKSNINTIEYLFEFMYSKTKLLEFSKNEFKNLFTDYHLSDDERIKIIFSRTSYAVWIYSLLKKTNY